MLHTPFYDPYKSYEDNYRQGPFGAFVDGDVFTAEGEPLYEFLGHKLYSPFGIAAGSILNSKYAKAAFEKGFDILVYKTVRSDIFPCHPFPNVLPLDIDGNLTMEKAKGSVKVKKTYEEPLSVTNSFGVPSRAPQLWQEDFKKALSYVGKGQLLILSFMGTVRPNQTQEEFIQDFAKAAHLAYETGAEVLEVNLSCPNIGNEGLVCYNLDVTEKVLQAIRKEIEEIPLIVKVGYFENQEQLEKMASIIHNHAQAIAAINTIPSSIVDDNGNQALPGPNRLKSGVCGKPIKWAGVEMVKRLKTIKEQNNYSYSIVGVGGVTEVNDYHEYTNAGADVVMSVTGAMWNPFLAQEIKSSIK